MIIDYDNIPSIFKWAGENMAQVEIWYSSVEDNFSITVSPLGEPEFHIKRCYSFEYAHTKMIDFYNKIWEERSCE